MLLGSLAPQRCELHPVAPYEGQPYTLLPMCSSEKVAQPTETTACTVPGAQAIPVVVELQRLEDSTFFKYNVNVLTSESGGGGVQTQAPLPQMIMLQPSYQIQSSNKTLKATTPEVYQNMIPYDGLHPPVPVIMQAVPATSAPVDTSAPENMCIKQPAIISNSNYISEDRPQMLQLQNPIATNSEPTYNNQYITPLFWNYPEELKRLFRWNFCDLCNTSLESTQNALDHYSSGSHDRNASTWMMNNFNQLCKFSKEVMSYIKAVGEDAFYCELCDLHLTSISHAKTHFFGRRHSLVARRTSKPNGPGYFDASGRWVRTNIKWLSCPLCGLNTTSESQLTNHLSGSKHRKRADCFNIHSLNIDGSYIYYFLPNGTLSPLNPRGRYLMLGINLNQYFEKLKSLNAIYFCELCEVPLNHFKSVKQHEEGHLHRKKLRKLYG